MKNIKILLMSLILTACNINLGIENRNDAKEEIETILKDLKIENDEVICVNGVKSTSTVNCSINKKNSIILDDFEIIGTAVCRTFECYIYLR